MCRELVADWETGPNERAACQYILGSDLESGDALKHITAEMKYYNRTIPRDCRGAGGTWKKCNLMLRFVRKKVLQAAEGRD